MLEQVSWKDFLIALGGGCAAYYGLLLVAGKLRLPSKRDKLPQNLPLVAELAHPPQKETAGLTEEVLSSRGSETVVSEDDLEFNALELLAGEVQTIITQFAVSGGSKENLLAQLSKAVAHYPALHKPAFQQAISNLIVKVAREECQLTISMEEARECWPD